MRKNRKKIKILTVLLAGSMLALSGCQDAGRKPEEKEQEEAAQEQENTDAPKEAPGEAEEEKEAASEVLQITFISEAEDDYDPESGQWLLHTEYQRLEATGSSEEAAQALEEWSRNRVEEIEQVRAQYAANAMEEGREPSDYYQYSIYESLEAVRIDRRVVSLVEQNSEYSGGAHGNYGSTAVNFDAQAGEILKLSDILTDEEGFQKKAEEELIRKLSDTYQDGLFPGYEDTIRQMWESGPNWYLDGAGITFIFQPYLIGPYAMGEARVTLPYKEMEAYLEPSWLPERLSTATGVGVLKIPAEEEIPLFFSETDSQAHVLRLGIAGEEGYGPIRLELGDSSVETESFERIGSAFLDCRTDGRVFLIFDADYASDDFVTFVYELTDGVLKECDRKEGLSVQGGTVNTESLRLRMHLDVLGTYTSFMDYTIDGNGNLEASGEWFEIAENSSAWQELLTVRELPVRIKGEETTLPAGSHIRITATDNQGIARFTKTDTGESGEIHYVRGDGAEDTWTIYIDGVPDYEYFETLPYAG